MNRRKAVLTAIGTAVALQAQTKKSEEPVIQLHVDMTVEPAKEKDLKKNFKEIFKPAMAKQPGYLHVYLLKLREAKAGKAPEGANYRLVINFKTEQDRLNWVKTDIHQKAWPTIEGTFKVKSYTAILYDQI
ncbi:MAG TPA: antibiotic biosynthesis monooxygenase [Bryobacteraceae bacterium]|nr:antibiotic biosynthesis monooxygenase [Bryobacteraceae bacterium]